MTAPIGIIAGGGALPLSLAQALLPGSSAFVIRLEGFADKALDAYPGADLNIGEIGGVINALHGAGCRTLAFAGDVKRPEFDTIQLDTVGQSHLARLVAAAQLGDDGLLTQLVQIFVSEGFDVVGAETLCPDLLSPVGQIAGAAPDMQAMDDLAKALRIARMIGAEDIGQGCVVANGLVLALEAQEGTDGMLRRLADLPLAVRGTPERRKGVLVKCAKPEQDRRIDLPVIGANTIENAAHAGLLGVGVEAASSLIIEREAVEELARQHDLFVIGLEHNDSADAS